jgi:hypothetical protein
MNRLDFVKIAKRMVSSTYVEDINILTMESLKDLTKDLDVYIDCIRIESVEEYNRLLERIMSDIPEVKEYNKGISSGKLELTYCEKTDNGNNYIRINIRCYDKDVLGEIVGCKLVFKDHRYTTLSCELKQ